MAFVGSTIFEKFDKQKCKVNPPPPIKIAIGLCIHNRIQVDPSLITGNDIYVAPTVGLTDNAPYESTLSGGSSFHKVLNLSRLFGDFDLLDPMTVELNDETVDLSFVNNIGHSWIC